MIARLLGAVALMLVAGLAHAQGVAAQPQSPAERLAAVTSQSTYNAVMCKGLKGPGVMHALARAAQMVKGGRGKEEIIATVAPAEASPDALIAAAVIDGAVDGLLESPNWFWFESEDALYLGCFQVLWKYREETQAGRPPTDAIVAIRGYAKEAFSLAAPQADRKPEGK